jgi:hypothetical protein
VFFYSAISLYLSVTESLLRQPPPEFSEGFDAGFWSQAIGLEPVQYARVVRALEDFKYKDVAIRVPGYYFENWGGAYFINLYTYAGDQRREQHGDCMRRHRGNFEAEKACQIEVDKKYCATVRRLHADWLSETVRLHEKLGRRFDGVAAAMLVSAGDEVDDAFRYAAKYAKEMKVKPGDVRGPEWMRQLNRQGQEWVRDLNKRYRDLVAQAVGEGDGGPAARIRHEAETYRMYKQNAETSIGQYGNDIAERCEPVDRKVFEQLLEEQRKATSEMLLERLIRDLNAEWDPNAKCSLSCGKWISITVDIDNNVKFGGKWEPYKKAFEGSPTWDLGKYFKSGIKDGRYVVVNLSADQSGNYGPFTGKAGVTAGMQVDPRTGKIDLPVSASAKLGFGFKKKVGVMGRQEEIGFT